MRFDKAYIDTNQIMAFFPFFEDEYTKEGLAKKVKKEAPSSIMIAMVGGGALKLEGEAAKSFWEWADKHYK